MNRVLVVPWSIAAIYEGTVATMLLDGQAMPSDAFSLSIGRIGPMEPAICK